MMHDARSRCKQRMAVTVGGLAGLLFRDECGHTRPLDLLFLSRVMEWHCMDSTLIAMPSQDAVVYVVATSHVCVISSPGSLRTWEAGNASGASGSPRTAPFRLGG